MSGPWESSDVPRGHAYDRRFEDLAASGMDMHGEAALVASLARGPASVLDAGCGTGRVAIELTRRGHAVVGVDVDGAMLEAARAKAPDLTWVHGDLADPGLELGGRIFDIVVMAGNVVIFVPPGTEGRVVRNAARWLRPGGLLVTGYSLRPDGFGPDRHDALAVGAGLVLQDRWSTWDKQPYASGDRYAVAVHRREI
jgi:SAM-dependent methyltransferase